MKRHRACNTPTPSELAAYLDGENNGEESARVEEWLAQNPELAAELEAHEEVSRLYQSAPPPEPSAEAWDGLLARIETELTTRSTPLGVFGHAVDRDDSPRPRRSWLAWTAAVAAGILIALAYVGNPRPRDLAGRDSLPVASDDDVNILSVHGQDIAMLVVGAVPLQEPLALATAHDVTVENVQPDSDGMMPQIGTNSADASSPMIVAPIGGNSEKAP